MKKLNLPLLLLAFLTPPVSAYSQELRVPDAEEIIHKLEKVRQTLKTTPPQEAGCETPSSPDCRFESYCEQLGKKAHDLYLYQDRQGRQVPNFSMTSYLQKAELCVDSPFPQAPAADPFAYPAQFLDEKQAGGKSQLAKNRSRLEVETQRTKRIFTEAQERSIQFLQSKKTPATAAQIDNMITRIKSVRFRPPNMSKDLAALAEDGCESPNAYFDPATHSITVCPQLMNMPDAALFATLAHEFGHSIDSCAMSYDNTAKSRILPEWMDAPPNKEPILTPAIPMAKNPFNSVLTCLQSEDSIGVQVPTQEELLHNIELDMSSLYVGDPAEGIPGESNFNDATEAIFEDQKKAIHNHYQNFKHCSIFDKSGHMQEAFSDWLASQILAKKITDLSQKGEAREYAFAALTPFYSMGCENIQKSVLTQLENSTSQRCQELSYIKESLEDEPLAELTHPKFSRRVNKILYAKSEIRQALGCRSKENGKECK